MYKNYIKNPLRDFHQSFDGDTPRLHTHTELKKKNISKYVCAKRLLLDGEKPHMYKQNNIEKWRIFHHYLYFRTINI